MEKTIAEMISEDNDNFTDVLLESNNKCSDVEEDYFSETSFFIFHDGSRLKVSGASLDWEVLKCPKCGSDDTAEVMTVEELKTYGFDGDEENMVGHFHDSDVESYYEIDADVTDEIENYEEKTLELVAAIEDGIVVGFTHAYGKTIETVGAHDDDDTNGVIGWLRR